MHAFLQERSQKYFQNELLESTRQRISLACSVLRGRAQNDVFQAATFQQKKTFKKMMAEFPEIKLVKLLIIALRQKNTLMKRHCVGQTFIAYCSKAATLQQKPNLFK